VAQNHLPLYKNMQPNQPSFGTGANLLGDTSALRQVMSQSGMDTSVLDQVSGNAPTARPNMAPTQALPTGGAPQPQVTPMTPTPTGLPAGNPEAQIIVRALGARLQGLTKMGQ